MLLALVATALNLLASDSNSTDGSDICKNVLASSVRNQLNKIGSCATIIDDQLKTTDNSTLTVESITLDGATAMGGDLPINPSGGVLSTNPIGASGMIRFAEAAMQVRGDAGAHQVDGARLALGHAYGGASQFFAMWVVGSERP